MKPQRKVSEREERERQSSSMSKKPFKVPREALPPRAWGIYNPFPQIKTLWSKWFKTRLSWTVCDLPMGRLCLNPTVKMWSWTTFKPSHWGWQTVRQDLTKCLKALWIVCWARMVHLSAAAPQKCLCLDWGVNTNRPYRTHRPSVVDWIFC
jgi:hypothetical protein